MTGNKRLTATQQQGVGLAYVSAFMRVYVGGASPQPAQCLPSTQSTTRQPHTVPSALSTKRGLSQLRTGCGTMSANYVNNLPSGSNDVSGFQALQFRVSVNYNDSRNTVNMPQNFSVVLTDGTGPALERASAITKQQGLGTLSFTKALLLYR